jgi:hypothetical protein
MRLFRWTALLAAAALVGFVIVEGSLLDYATVAPPLTQIYSPTFSHVPAPLPVRRVLSRLQRALQSPTGEAFLQSTVPSESGALWLALIVALVIGFDFEHLDNPRNVDLVLMQALGFSFFEILAFLRKLQQTEFVQLMQWVFVAVFTLNFLLLVRALWRIHRPFASPWRPSLPRRALAAVALALIACDVMAAVVREPDDVGYFVNLGAQRLRERGRFPYGDPLLTGTPGAAYGPLLYVAHLPFQLLLAPGAVNAESPDRPTLGPQSTYRLPPQLATKLCTIAFHLCGLAALFFAARRLADASAAWAIVALYAGSAFVLGVGGDNDLIGGMTFASHISSTAVTLVAFSLLGRPAAAGIGLAAAAGVGFYPAFMAPAWLGYYWNRERERWRFLVGFAGAMLAIGIPVLLLSRPAAGRGLIGTILWDTFGHHTDPKGYGASPFSFWGQQEGLRGWLMRPLVGESGFTSPVFLSFLGLVVAGFWIARRRTPQQLALATAAIAIAASLLKIHSTGTYVEWSYPFLLLGLFA